MLTSNPHPWRELFYTLKLSFRATPFLSTAATCNLEQESFAAILQEDPVMLDEFLDSRVVVDLASMYVCLGRLVRFDDQFLELKNADLHDLRDTETTRELYVADSVATGIKRNRKRLLVRRAEVVAISRLEDVVDE